MKGKLNNAFDEPENTGIKNFINFTNYVLYGTPNSEEKTIDITPEAGDEDER